MNRKLVALVALAWAGTALAGDFHYGKTLRCSQCHTMHASRKHGFIGNGTTLTTEGLTAVTTGVANSNLLISKGTNATCLACHDTTAAVANGPDVLGTEARIYSAFVADGRPVQDALQRSAGALNGSDGTGGGLWPSDPLYHNDMGHTMGTGDLPPGDPAMWFTANLEEGFNCAQCHRVHGSAAYRNLGSSAAGVFPTYNARPNYGENDRTSVSFVGTNDVTIKNAERTYRTQDVAFGVGGASGSGMNGYCATCHGFFHGDANTQADDFATSQNFVRHPTTGIRRVDVSEAADNAEFSIVRPAWVATENAGAFEAACLSCHKGHGNQRGYGLIYPDPTVAGARDYENGNAAAGAAGSPYAGQYPLRNLCSTCHEEGQEAGNL